MRQEDQTLVSTAEMRQFFSLCKNHHSWCNWRHRVAYSLFIYERMFQIKLLAGLGLGQTNDKIIHFLKKDAERKIGRFHNRYTYLGRATVLIES